MQNRTDWCSKLKSPETRQVQERLVSTLEHLQVTKWTRIRCPIANSRLRFVLRAITFNSRFWYNLNRYIHKKTSSFVVISIRSILWGNYSSWIGKIPSFFSSIYLLVKLWYMHDAVTWTIAGKYRAIKYTRKLNPCHHIIQNKIFTLPVFSATINIRKILTFNFRWSDMRRCNGE